MPSLLDDIITFLVPHGSSGGSRTVDEVITTPNSLGGGSPDPVVKVTCISTVATGNTAGVGERTVATIQLPPCGRGRRCNGRDRGQKVDELLPLSMDAASGLLDEVAKFVEGREEAFCVRDAHDHVARVEVTAALFHDGAQLSVCVCVLDGRVRREE